MGQEAETEARRDAFAGYRVDDALLDAAGPDAVAMHCLPAHRGEEITSAVMDGPRSVIWDQSENRLHVQKALLVEVLGGWRRAAGDRERRCTSATRTRSGAATSPPLRGRLDAAIDAYGEAARSPRTGPCRMRASAGSSSGSGGCPRRSPPTTAALELAPRDEGALRGPAERRWRPSGGATEAADDARSPGRRASTRAGRLADATDVARRALELAESRGRRRQVEAS